MILEPIGIIHTPFLEKSQCPIQPLYAAEAVGRLEVFEPYAAGLKDIEAFSHLYLLYRFDRAETEIQLIRATFLDDEPHGIFASRHPCRPNGIGLSIVRLLKREANWLEVQGIDVLNQTPLLDIKPYIKRFDCHGDATEGWVAQTAWRPKPQGRE
jgi:tRNA-Thr(GGU) m(6)t(6)A37 methyltransferase TsaA